MRYISEVCAQLACVDKMPFSQGLDHSHFYRQR